MTFLLILNRCLNTNGVIHSQIGVGLTIIVQNVRRVRNLRNLHFRQRKILYKIRKNPYNEVTNNEFRKKCQFSKAECLHILLYTEFVTFYLESSLKTWKPISFI